MFKRIIEKDKKDICTVAIFYLLKLKLVNLLIREASIYLLNDAKNAKKFFDGVGVLTSKQRHDL